MKKTVFLIVCLALLAGTLHAKQHELVKEVDDLNIKVVMDNNPPVIGENNLDITITDSEGRPVTKAKLKVDYSMPPMKNMPPMQYKTRAKFDGKAYKAKVNLSMSGKWDIAINIKRPGKPLTKMEFDLNVP